MVGNEWEGICRKFDLKELSGKYLRDYIQGNYGLRHQSTHFPLMALESIKAPTGKP